MQSAKNTRFLENRKVPTSTKMVTAINEDQTLPNLKRSSFQKVLKDLQFEYVKKTVTVHFSKEKIE